MPADDSAERSHHLQQLHGLVSAVAGHGMSRQDRIDQLRLFYERASQDFTGLASALPRKALNDNHRRRWVDEPYEALRTYSQGEGLWR